MTSSDKLLLAVGVLLACGFLLLMLIMAPTMMRLVAGARRPTPDVVSTFRALVSTGVPVPIQDTPNPGGTAVAGTSVPPVTGGGPGGHIVWTCQLYKDQGSEQICIMNSDGSGVRTLTSDYVRHFYPSLSPDGKSIVYAHYGEENVFQIYEIDLKTGQAKQLTDRLGVLNAPEISPDGKSIVFMCWTPDSDQNQVWIMDRDGSHPRRLFKGDGWDPTWSPDGSQVLFASDRDGPIELYMGNADGSHVRKISNLPSIRGRSDWSQDNLITTYSGEAWARNVFVMNAD